MYTSLLPAKLETAFSGEVSLLELGPTHRTALATILVSSASSLPLGCSHVPVLGTLEPPRVEQSLEGLEHMKLPKLGGW